MQFYTFCLAHGGTGGGMPLVLHGMAHLEDHTPPNEVVDRVCSIQMGLSLDIGCVWVYYVSGKTLVRYVAILV